MTSSVGGTQTPNNNRSYRRLLSEPQQGFLVPVAVSVPAVSRPAGFRDLASWSCRRGRGWPFRVLQSYGQTESPEVSVEVAVLIATRDVGHEVGEPIC